MKTLFFSFLLLCGSLGISAQTYNKQQEQLRTEISKYLYKQGLNPENQEDGLKFKSEGINYYIEIDKGEVNPMYLRLCRYVKYDNKITREKVTQNLNDCNSKYAVKVACQDKAVVLSTELFVAKSAEFTDVFDTLLDLLGSAYNVVKE